MLTLWSYVLLVIVIVLIYVSLTTTTRTQQRSFENFESSFELKTNKDLYDSYYSNIYDQLVYNENKNMFEITSILNSCKVNKNDIVLDVGCGTGHHADLISRHVKNVIAIDTSTHMLEKAKQNYKTLNNVQFQEGNALDFLRFPPGSFDIILCMYFTIYYFQDKQLFFHNCLNWLKPGENKFLVVHIVDRDNFDPVIPPSSPFLYVNPQTFAPNRIMKSSVVFDNFKYKANFILNEENETALFQENFYDLNSNKITRKNEHTLYMQSEKQIIDIAKSLGFRVHSKIDLLKAAYEYQYIYLLNRGL